MKVSDVKIEFKDLSLPLKTSVVISFIMGSIYLIAFITGVIIGILEAA